MIEALKHIDEQVFLFFNGFHNEFFDVVMFWVTYKYTWFPFYLGLIVLAVYKYQWQGALMMLTVLISVGLGDQLTSGLMKPYFGRLRPCYNPSLEGMVHVVAGCGGRFGFASAHAATTFALASSMYLLMRGWSRYFIYLFVWAAIVSYSRIYVGVHYPVDIMVGALGGTIIGWIMFRLYTLLTTRLLGYPAHSQYLEAHKVH